ncbi:unnamed protein product [Coregonus sp. 'balchen']|nr:unnamed protein product [Coregonus sp. 'balchen']
MPNFFTYTSAMNICGFLLILTGTWAEVPPIDKYGLKGGLVCLAVEESPVELKKLKWRFESDVIVDDKEISPNYKEKVDYNPVNHSLCIKNLKETDSGTYIETCTLSQQSLSLTGVNITISNDNNNIQCTGKNHVSAETNSERLKDICYRKEQKR